MTSDKKRNAKKPDPDKRVYTKVYFLLTPIERLAMVAHLERLREEKKNRFGFV